MSVSISFSRTISPETACDTLIAVREIEVFDRPRTWFQRRVQLFDSAPRLQLHAQP